MLGDSYVAGSEQIIAGAMPIHMAIAMGWEGYICGQGSSGYSVALGDTSDGRTKYNNTGRLSRIKSLFDNKKIDALIVLGSINDGDTAPATVGADAAAVFTYFRDNVPTLPIVSASSVGITKTTNLTNVNVQLSQQAALFANVKGHFSQYQWFTDNLLIPGTPHLTRQGRKIHGQRVGIEARRILQAAGFTAA